MATYAPVAYTTAANNTQIDFDITFTFLRNQDLAVSVIDPSGNVLVAGTGYDTQLQTQSDGTFDMRVVQAGTLTTTNTPLTAGHVISIKRNTDISTILTVFQDGASFKAADINAIINQLFNNAQETAASVGEGIGLTDDLLAYDADNKPLRNLAAPTADTDAVRKIDVDSGIGADITTVAGIASDVTSVVADAADIGVVAANLSGSDTIGTVAGSIANVDNVGGSIANVNAVAADAADIGVVATDLSGSDTIGTVAGIASAVSSVAADATDIGVVAADLSGSDTIGTVAGIASAVSNVSSISAAVTSVNDNSTNINTVAGDTSAINTLATGTDSGGTAYLTHLENASTNAAAAQAALTAFNRTYLGAYSADPTVDGNGDALTDGDLYYNTTDEVLKFYNDTDDAWVTLSNSVQVNAATTLGAVGDANFGTLLENDFIVRDGSNPAKWVNKTPAQARTSLGLGTAAVAATSDFATAAQGTTADSAVQPNDSPTFTKVTATDIVEVQGIGGSNDARYSVTMDGTQTGWFGTPSWNTDAFYVFGPNAAGNGVDQIIKYEQDELVLSTDNTNRLKIGSTGQVQLATYTGAGTHTGTAVKSLAVDSSGNVIEEQDVSSTATPSFGTLTATRATYPAVNVQETGQAGQGQLAQSGAEVQLRNTGNGGLSFFTDNTTRMRIGATGNVGIGTNSPDTLVEMVGADPVLTIRDSETGVANSSATLRLAETGASDTLDEYWDTQLYQGDYRVAYAGALRMTIDRISGEVKTLNSGNTVSLRKADRRSTTGTHTLVGGATLYYANAAATYNTSGLTPGDIVTIYNEGGGTVTVNTGGTVSLFKDGEASAVSSAVTIGADTIATVTCVSATKAIIAGSDLT